MDSLLDFSVPGVRGFLLPHPIVVDAGDRRYPRPRLTTLIHIGEPLGVRRPGFHSQVTG
jgi:hypothetical protein